MVAGHQLSATSFADDYKEDVAGSRPVTGHANLLASDERS